MIGKGPCGRCGVDPARGHAQINEVWYCHESMSDGPTCYMLANWDQHRELVPRSAWLRVLDKLTPDVAVDDDRFQYLRGWLTTHSERIVSLEDRVAALEELHGER